MNFERWKDIAELIGLAAVVASLVFVGLELRQSERTAQLELITKLRDANTTVKVLIAEHADIWSRGCVGGDLSPADQVRFASIYGVYLNANFNNWLARRVGTSRASDEPNFFIDSYAANSHRYPGFRAAAAAYGQWAELGSPAVGAGAIAEYVNAIAKRVRELQELEPEPLMDVARCGY